MVTKMKLENVVILLSTAFGGACYAPTVYYGVPTVEDLIHLFLHHISLIFLSDCIQTQIMNPKKQERIRERVCVIR